jgi:hypothetical protein
MRKGCKQALKLIVQSRMSRSKRKTDSHFGHLLDLLKIISCDTIAAIAAMVAIKLVIVAANFLFPVHDSIFIRLLEEASHVVVLLLYLIYAIIDLIVYARTLFKR